MCGEHPILDRRDEISHVDANVITSRGLCSEICQMNALDRQLAHFDYTAATVANSNRIFNHEDSANGSKFKQLDECAS